MKFTIVLVVIVLVIVCVYFVHRRGSQKPDSTYLGLRQQALHSTRAALGLPEPSDPAQPWGVLMDWGVRNGTATVVSFSDGSASIYLSGGGGYIGGGGKEPIRRAAQTFVGIAGEFQPQMRLTAEYPLPHSGEVTFYVLTDKGVFTSSASDEELKANRVPFAKLGNAAQQVITEYRLLQETGQSR